METKTETQKCIDHLNVRIYNIATKIVKQKKRNPIITISKYNDEYTSHIDNGHIRAFYGSLPVVIVKGLVYLLKNYGRY